MERSFLYRNNIQQITLIQKDIELLKNDWNLPAAEIRQILTVIEELFSLLIDNTYSGVYEHSIEVLVSKKENYLIFEMCDNGDPFNPLNPEQPRIPDINFSDKGNMGIILMKAFVDSFHYTRTDDKNVFIFKKTLKSSQLYS